MWKISLALIIIVGSATFYFTGLAYQKSGETAQQRTFFDATGNLHVLGIILGKSTLRDAELAFRSRADAAVFLYPKTDQPNKNAQYTGKLEAYFPSIADHTKVLLTMAVSDHDLETIRQRSSPPRIYPNGVIRMNLSNEDILGIQKIAIKELTLIPSSQLDEQTITAQFGQPDSKQKINPQETMYLFPEIGLTAIIHSEEKDKLIFRNTK